MSSHSDRARRALAQLAETDPALGALALWCRHRDDEVGATRTLDDMIFYGSDFDGHPLPQQVGLAAHHVLHVALRHSDRARATRERVGAFSDTLFGLAADAIVNETLIAAGHAMPRPCVRLCELLAAIEEPAQSPLSALADWDTERLAMRLHRDGRSGKAAQEYGATRQFVPDVTESEDGRSEDAESDWRGHVLRAMETGRQAGTGIGMLAQVVADLAPPRIPWERRLRGLLARALTEDPSPSWQRPAGRWAAMDAHARRSGGPAPVFQPGRRRSQLRPRIVVGLDTSSSIAPDTLRLLAAEADGIARRTGAETHLLGFDTQVHREERLRPGQRLAHDPVALRTGGGTDFRPLIARAGQLAPSVLVILTDLDAPTGSAPAFPVIWVAPPGAPVPQFGTVLTV